MPNLLYLLKTSECGDNPLLDQFDNILWKGLTEILNVDLNDDQWLQASPPVEHGGLGIRSDRMLAPSAFFGIGCFHTPAPAVHSSGQYVGA